MPIWRFYVFLVYTLIEGVVPFMRRSSTMLAKSGPSEEYLVEVEGARGPPCCPQNHVLKCNRILLNLLYPSNLHHFTPTPFITGSIDFVFLLQKRLCADIILDRTFRKQLISLLKGWVLKDSLALQSVFRASL